MRSLEISAPRTGSASRHAELPAFENPVLEEEQYEPPPMVKLPLCPPRPGQEATPAPLLLKRCVYKYSDKYSFSRILMAGSLVFDSHFECGNLESAHGIRTSDSENADYSSYELFMHQDVDSSRASNQWFCFSVKNTIPGKTITFKVCNFSKPDSLYRQGMMVLMRSTRAGGAWVRCGSDISYTRNSAKSRKTSIGAKYTLSFTHTFEKLDDEVVFSYSHPYSFTDLQRSLDAAGRAASSTLIRDLQPPFLFRRSILCKTIAGNSCFLLTISGHCGSLEQLVSKPVILVTARVHPGESNSSFVMEGFLNFILGNSTDAALVRKYFVVKVIPMLNPDGVVNGNNRNSVSGFDLNRVWACPDMNLHPTIFHAKSLISKLSKSRHLCLCLDLHGHSRKQGIFVYGCVPSQSMIKSSQAEVRPLNDSDTVTAKSRPPLALGRALTKRVSSAPSAPTAAKDVSETAVKQEEQVAANSFFSPVGLPPGEIKTETGIVESPLVSGLRSVIALAAATNPPVVARNIKYTRPFDESTELAYIDSSAGSAAQMDISVSGMDTGKSRGCRSTNSSPFTSDMEQKLDFLNWKVRLFPKIMEKCIPSYNSDASWFKMDSSKSSTMRMVLFTEYGIDCSYTIETSLAGFDSQHFKASDLKALGTSIGESIVAWGPVISEDIFYLSQGTSASIDDVIHSEPCSVSLSKCCLADKTAVRKAIVEEVLLWIKKTDSNGVPFFGRNIELSQILTAAAWDEIRISRSSWTYNSLADGRDSEEDESDEEDVSSSKLIPTDVSKRTVSVGSVNRPPRQPRRQSMPLDVVSSISAEESYKYSGRYSSHSCEIGGNQSATSIDQSQIRTIDKCTRVRIDADTFETPRDKVSLGSDVDLQLNKGNYSLRQDTRSNPFVATGLLSSSEEGEDVNIRSCKRKESRTVVPKIVDLFATMHAITPTPSGTAETARSSVNEVSSNPRKVPLKTSKRAAAQVPNGGSSDKSVVKNPQHGHGVLNKYKGH